MFTVRASEAVTLSRHGVRQVPPVDARASAPGGADSTASTPDCPPDDPPKLGMLGSSTLGIHDDEHPVRMKPHATTAMTRLMLVPPITRFPRMLHGGRTIVMTPEGCNRAPLLALMCRPEALMLSAPFPRATLA